MVQFTKVGTGYKDEDMNTDGRGDSEHYNIEPRIATQRVGQRPPLSSG